MAKVLDAINGLDMKLSTISTDIQLLNNKSERLSSQYESLKEQIQVNDTKHEDHWKELEIRLDKLEGDQSKVPTNLQLGDLREELTKAISEKLESQLMENRAMELEDVSSELARKMNRAMEAMDAYERNSKKLNLVVSGLAGERDNLEMKTRELLRDKFDVTHEIKSISILENCAKAVVIMNNWEAKLKIIKTKRETLAKTNIFIERDMTLREQRIQANLREVAREKKADNCKVSLSFQKIKINSLWYDWDEFNCRIVRGEPPSDKRGNKSSFPNNNGRHPVIREQSFHSNRRL